MAEVTSEAVAAFLKDHPEFFEQEADMLADIYIPHPHGGRAIPISERQILTLRERGKQLETKLREVIQFGEENDAIGDKVHRLALALLSARDVAAVATVVTYNLREDFAVPHVAMRAWRSNGDAGSDALTPASDATREFAKSLSAPHCAHHAADGTSDDLFGDAAEHLRSYAYIPLRAPQPVTLNAPTGENGHAAETFGVLALGSEDAERFYPGMGTVFLRRIGDMVGAALLRNMDA